MTPQERAIAAFEDTPIAVIAKLTGLAPGTIKSHRHRISVRGVGSVTPTQTLVLEHLARGLTNKEVALALGISERTVKAHKCEAVLRLGREAYRQRINGQSPSVAKPAIDTGTQQDVNTCRPVECGAPTTKEK